MLAADKKRCLTLDIDSFSLNSVSSIIDVDFGEELGDVSGLLGQRPGHTQRRVAQQQPQVPARVRQEGPGVVDQNLLNLDSSLNRVPTNGIFFLKRSPFQLCC